MNDARVRSTLATSAMLRDVEATFERSPHSCAACGAKVLHRGVCGDCEARQHEERARREKVNGALLSIPLRYRWARFEAP